MFLVNSRYPLVTAAPLSSGSKSLHPVRAHLLPKLRCQFAEFLNQSSLKRLRMLSSSTCVGFRYDQLYISTRGFSWKRGINELGIGKAATSHHPLELRFPVCPKRVLGNPPTGLNRTSISGLAYPSPSPLASTIYSRCRNMNLLAIDYAFRPRLRYRLTLGGLTLPRKPRTYGEPVSHRLYRYSCQHYHFQPLQPSLRSTFAATGTLPYHFNKLKFAASVLCLSPVKFSAQVRLTSELLRFL